MSVLDEPETPSTRNKGRRDETAHVVEDFVGALFEELHRGAPPVAPELQSRLAEAVRLRDAARAHVLRHCGEPDLSG